ncbi:MAG: sigma 54-interacting transcriptional regulator [Desulfobacterales bacterium]
MTNTQTQSNSGIKFLNPEERDRVFRTILERSLSGLLIFQENRVVYANPALQEIFGLSEDEILRTDPFDLIHHADRDLVKQRAAQRLKGMSPPDDYELRIITAEGKTRWVRLLATGLDFREEPAILANIIDIDESKRAEELRLETEKLRTTLLDGIPHPAMLIRKDRTILAANRNARDLGASIGGHCGIEFGRGVFSHTASVESQAAPGGNADSKNTRCSFCKADQAFERRAPVRMLELEASGRFWDAHWIPIDEDTYLHYAMDVTARKKIEREIRNSEERYRLITETMSDGLSIQNHEGVITQVNGRLCEISGFARDELIGRSLLDLLAGGKDGFAEIVNEGGTQNEHTSETLIHHKDGRKVAVSLKIDSLIDDSGSYKGSFAFFTDISELKILRRHSLTADTFENIVGREISMRKLFAEIIELAACDFPVLIQGDSGVGKELVAQAIHNISHRSDAMFVPVNCAALPENLLESELFGHVKGAFTGAIRDKKGRFELAHGGTIFLDEIAELSPSVQVKLLRILQEGEFERVGDHRTTKVDVRIISATNKNLEREKNAGRFRGDLYYRLCVMPVFVPPLRERKNDIPLLAHYFIKSIAGKTSDREASLSTEALVMLMAYDWPGNVRELQNAIQFAYVKSKGDVILPVHLPAAVRQPASKIPRRRRRRRKLDQNLVLDALSRTKGNKLQAAKLLSVNRATLYRFLAETKDKK